MSKFYPWTAWSIDPQNNEKSNNFYGLWFRVTTFWSQPLTPLFQSFIRPSGIRRVLLKAPFFQKVPEKRKK